MPVRSQEQARSPTDAPAPFPDEVRLDAEAGFARLGSIPLYCYLISILKVDTNLIAEIYYYLNFRYLLFRCVENNKPATSERSRKAVRPDAGIRASSSGDTDSDTGEPEPHLLHRYQRA